MIRTWLFTGTSALVAIGLAASAPAQTQTQSTAPATTNSASATIAAATSWEHKGSDIPADPEWHTGTLPNGLDYAVRQNTQPPGTIAIRVRIGVGGLDEKADQQGWSHLLEHMAFRGTENYPDGDAIKIWQRLGASFGTDTNAETTYTATTFKLDLPKSDAASYQQALAIMADMVQSATIGADPLATERKVVIAERQARVPPLLRKIQDASDAVMLTGLEAAKRDLGGTDATLAAANADPLKAFYHSWYRPDRATVIVVGDADPALLEAGVKAAFGGWRDDGKGPPDPDYGAIANPAVPAAVVVDPQAPNVIDLAWMRPHDEAPFTIARQQQQFACFVATAIISQRLATEAQKGQAIVNAAASYPTARHIADQLSVSVTPKPDGWKAALDETFGVLNRLRASPPSQAEIDQQAAIIEEGLNKAIDARESETSNALADAYIGDVDQRDVTPTPAFYLKLFQAEKPSLTPDVIAKAIAEQLAPDPRMLLLSPTPIDGGDAAAAAALEAARKIAAANTEALRKVSLDELKLPGSPGKVVSTSKIDDLGIERVRYANGVELDFKKTPYEKGTIRLQIEIGHGVLNHPVDDPGLFWSSAALAAAGIGPFTPDELVRLAAGRQVGFGLQATEKGLAFGSHTNQADIGDAMKLMTGALTQMRYAETPITRLRNSYKASYQALYSAPGSVLQIFGAPYFHGGDTRFRAVPPPQEVDALTLPAFRAFWQQQLAVGPIKVIAVGDLDPDKLIADVGKTFGALPARSDDKPNAAELAVTAAGAEHGPIILHHNGDADQAAVARVYPTTGMLRDLNDSAALDVAATIIQQRLTEDFREKQGGSYTPFAASTQSTDLPDYGLVLAGAQLQTERIDDFYRTLDGIVAGLADKGPDVDELSRAVTTQVSTATRAETDNAYWLGRLDGDLDDPRFVAALRGYKADLGKVDGAAVQAAARKYLANASTSFKIEALPEKTAAAK